MMRRYPAYRNSGVEWLGDVPEEWKVAPARRLFRQVRDAARPEDEQLSATQKHGVIPQRLFMAQEDQKVVLALSGLGNFKRVEEGDFVISLRSFQGGIEYSAYSGCVSPAYTVLRSSKNFFDAYFKYLLKCDPFITVLQSVTSGIRDGRNVSYDQFGMVALPLPKPEEQTAIAAFLDRETAKIDALVEEQRRLIALLREKRQAVISHAVTKGLNPAAPMKPSGVDWLGDVPERWEVKRLKNVVPSVTVGIVVEPSKYYVKAGVPALRSLNVRPGKITAENLVFISDEANELQAKSKLNLGDIVAVRTGQPGTCAVVTEEFNGCNCIDLIIIRRPTTSNSQYLFWYLNSDFALRQFSEGSGGAIQLHFNVSTATELVICVPPIDEQHQIVRYLSSSVSALDQLVDAAGSAICLLQERRAAIISAAVTGKIDVRDLAAAETEAA